MFINNDEVIMYNELCLSTMFYTNAIMFMYNEL